MRHNDDMNPGEKALAEIDTLAEADGIADAKHALRPDKCKADHKALGRKGKSKCPACGAKLDGGKGVLSEAIEEMLQEWRGVDFDPRKHPRGRSGRFIDVLGKLGGKASPGRPRTARTNEDVFKRAFAGEEARANSVTAELHGKDMVIKSYAEPIAIIKGNKAFVSRHKYSATTSQHQSAARGYAGLKGLELVDVDRATAHKLAGSAPGRENYPWAHKNAPEKTDWKMADFGMPGNFQPGTLASRPDKLKTNWKGPTGPPYSRAEQDRIRTKLLGQSQTDYEAERARIRTEDDQRIADLRAKGFDRFGRKIEKPQGKASPGKNKDFWDRVKAADTRQFDASGKAVVTDADANTIPDANAFRPLPGTEAHAVAGRPINELARMVEQDWGPNVSFAARPYLDAMRSLRSVNAKYGLDDGKTIVAYFLSNATGWRGPVAKAVKKELRRRL